MEKFLENSLFKMLRTLFKDLIILGKVLDSFYIDP